MLDDFSSSIDINLLLQIPCAFYVDDVTCFDRFGVSVYVPVRFDLKCLGLRLFATVMVVALQII